jgi:hypothetical protein
MLLDKLPQCGDQAFDAFIAALNETEQSDLADMVLGHSANAVPATNSVPVPMAAGGTSVVDVAPISDEAVILQKLRFVEFGSEY